MTAASSVADAQALALSLCAPGLLEQVPPADAFDRILREAIVARADVPAQPTSMMDGYAVHAGPAASLRIVEESAAGRPSRRALAIGEAAPISTGALLPPGADAIVPIEDTNADGDRIAVPQTTAGRFVRAPGSEVRAGEQLLEPGRTIDGGAIGLLCAEGHATVAVAARPRVAILSTGAELRLPGEPLAAGMVYDANGPALRALVYAAGAQVERAEIVADDLTATVAAIEAALACDLILISGGVSVGAHDHVRAAVKALGGEILLWRVAMKPGKPLMLARIGDRRVVGLPGNPVSAQVGHWLFVRPMVRRLLGAEPADDLVRAQVRLDAPLSMSTDRPTYLRARVRADGATLVARLAPRQGSAAMVGWIDANALVCLSPGEHTLPAGAELSALLYAPLR